MGLFELLLIAIGLAMDAFAVSVCKGLNMKSIKIKNCVIIAFFFGAFQAIMPAIGWVLASSFAEYIENIDHWVAFILLSFIGLKMLYEAFKDEEIDKKDDDKIKIKELLILSVATSIDALAVGITFAMFLNTKQMIFSVSGIGAVTFVLSFFGVIIGNHFGAKLKKRAEVFGGVILVLIGFKILVEHLFF